MGDMAHLSALLISDLSSTRDWLASFVAATNHHLLS